MTSRSRSPSRSSVSSHKLPAEDSAGVLSTPVASLPEVSPTRSCASDAALEAIAMRVESGEFPAVLPAEVEAAHCERATQAITWIKKDEATRIQSYMHLKYHEYRSTLPVQGDRPESVIHAEWARLYYYFHLEAWCSRHGCVKSDTFIPAVPPELLPEAQRLDAESLLSQLLGRQSLNDGVAFESLVKQELAAFMRVLPASLSTEVMDGSIDAFYQERYYSILSQYLADRAKSEFVPMVEVANLPAPHQDLLKQFIPQLQAKDEKEFHDLVLTTWESTWEKMPTQYLQGQKESIKCHWISNNYVPMLSEYLSQRASLSIAEPFVFNSLVPLADVSSEAERAKARQVIARVEPQHIDLIDRTLEDRWRAFRHLLPPALPEEVMKQIWHQWLLQHYFAVIGEVLEGAGAAAEFSPMVRLDEVPEGQDREQARALLELMTPTLGDVLKAKLEQKRGEVFRSRVLGEMQDFVERQWVVANYYVMMAEVVHGSARPASVATSAPKSPSLCVPDMFASPKRRARNTSESHAVPLVTRCVAECHTADISLSYSNRTEVYLLYFAEEPRWVDVLDKKTQLHERVPVLSCLFADRTGAIQADLWRTSAQTQLPLFTQWSDASDDPIMLEISGFGVKSERRRSLRPTRQLIVNDQTVFTRLQVGSPTSCLSADVPLSQHLLVNDYREITGSTPFFANLSGFLTNLSPVTLSRQDVPMRTFRMQDAAGRYVTCCLHGRHSINESLQDRSLVVVFFAVATESLGSNPAMLWLYDNSHLIIQRLGCIVPPSTQAVLLK